MAEALKEFIYSKEKSIVDFASRIDVNPNYLQQIVGGHRVMSSKIKSKIQNTFPDFRSFMEGYTGTLDDHIKEMTAVVQDIDMINLEIKTLITKLDERKRKLEIIISRLK